MASLNYWLQEWKRSSVPNDRLLPTPYRIVVFTQSTVTTGKGKRAKTKTVGSAYMGWTPTQSYQEARLEGAGSFLYPGLRAVRYAAYAYLALADTHQVQIRTNLDRKVYVYNKSADGRITGYMGAA